MLPEGLVTVREKSGILMTSFTAEDVEPKKFPSPLYTALMLCAPPARFESEIAAWPAFTAVDPRVFWPSIKVIVPVGAPVAGEFTASAAAKTTAWPTIAGFMELVRFVEVTPLLMTCAKTVLEDLKLSSPE